jgi:anti-sigma regulatory factor (Ser/Thr protein kinase)
MAMQEGFSTATDEMREMGFGAGMGLPNIKKNSDELKIDSEVGRGTKLGILIRTNAADG